MHDYCKGNLKGTATEDMFPKIFQQKVKTLTKYKTNKKVVFLLDHYSARQWYQRIEWSVQKFFSIQFCFLFKGKKKPVLKQ